jgi:hypothetical protein
MSRGKREEVRLTERRYPSYYISDLLTRISVVSTREGAEAEPRVEDSYPGTGGSPTGDVSHFYDATSCAFVGEASGPGSGPWPDSFDRLVIRLNRSSVELWVFGVLRRQLGQLAMLRIAHRSEPRPTSPV